MKQDDKHKAQSRSKSDPGDAFFAHADIPWKKSKAEVWNELEKSLEKKDRSPVPVRRMIPGKQWFALAASLVLLLSVGSFMRFYAVKTTTPEGVHTAVNLPDGSVVQVNAASSLAYHPYWWFASRKVSLEGEAFFSVEAGKRFRVVSDLGTTEVLGTTFNVFARDENYRVTCHSGSVRVSGALTHQSVVLAPSEQAVLDESGTLTVRQLELERQSPGWTRNTFMFNSAPLRHVFDEIERQYGIVIESPAAMPHVYSGNFSLDTSVENILYLLCLPFDLEYERQSGNVYLVHPSSD